MQEEDALDVLLPIQPRGTRPPLFCIHPGFGLSWCYIGLAKHLHTDQPLYGLQARGFNEKGDPAAVAVTLEDMAMDYIQQIRRIQPHGPYRLLGYSFGGIVAHTMAVHLERQGERVALLAIMDAPPSLGIMMEDSKSSKIRNWEESDNIPGVAGGYQGRNDTPDVAKSFLQKAPNVIRRHCQLATHHTPPRGYRGAMILFRAMIQKNEESLSISLDEWEPFVQGPIEVHDMNCTHDDMCNSVSLAVIGAILTPKLAEIM
jgi:thioesterase domain-containing protein